MNFRVDRSLLLDTSANAGTGEPLVSIRDVTWQHQAAAMSKGYNSMVEYAVDEMIGLIRDLTVRVDQLEQHIKTLQGWADS